MFEKRKRRRDGRKTQTRLMAQPHSTIVGELHELEDAERLVYSPRQAAEVLGLGVSTIDCRIVPAAGTVKAPRGLHLIPVAELRRFTEGHLEPASGGDASPNREGGGPVVLPRPEDRNRLECARSRAPRDRPRTQSEPELHPRCTTVVSLHGTSRSAPNRRRANGDSELAWEGECSQVRETGTSPAEHIANSLAATDTSVNYTGGAAMTELGGRLYHQSLHHHGQGTLRPALLASDAKLRFAGDWSTLPQSQDDQFADSLGTPGANEPAATGSSAQHRRHWERQ
jgi:hypothetical protein